MAGGVGALCRYYLASAVQRLNGGSFPWGTFAVNVVGCLLAGFLVSLFSSRMNLSPAVRNAVLVGFIGAFTTFSTFMVDTLNLVRTSHWLTGFANLIMQNLAGMGAVVLGVFAASNM
ncbi:MAG: fluoride efflux transporter CrcB [Thermanaerothrix sp.]|nr:fluoride efflux transporter CrcB [Thermanaerothrix sp.]